MEKKKKTIELNGGDNRDNGKMIAIATQIIITGISRI